MKILKEKKYSLLSGFLKYSFVFVLVFSVLMPIFFVGADVNVSGKIDNPIPSIPDLTTFVEGILKLVVFIGVPFLVLAVIYAGFLYVKAQGNPGELEVAHRTLLYTVIGGFLLLGAFVIARAIRGTVEDIKSTT